MQRAILPIDNAYEPTLVVLLAMLDPKHFAALQKHIQKNPGMREMPCPICGSKSWTAEGAGLLGIQESPPGVFNTVIGAGQIPLAVLICNTCYFVRQFALVPILREHGNG